MSEKRTRLGLPGQKQFPGISLWGEKSVAEMIEAAREHADWLRLQAAEIDLAADEQFQIEVVRGVHVPTVLRVLQEAKK